MSAQLDIDETSFVSSFFNDAYPNWSAEQVEQAAERTLRAVKNLRDLGILISVTEEAEIDKEVGVDNFIRGFLITSEEVLKRWARGFFDDCKGKQDAIGSIGIHVHTAAAERTRLLLLSPPPALLTEDDDETLQSTQKAHEALQPYKEAHVRLDALEFRLVTVALLAKNMTLKQLEDKKEELLRDFFAVEDDHEMAYTSEEKRRIVSHMHAKMDEVEPVAFDANLTSEAAMLRVMRQIGSVESANEVRCMIESSDSCVDSCDAELLRLAAAGAKFTLFRDSAFADADLAQHLSTGILLVPAFTGKALSDVLHDDRVLGVTQALDAFRSYRLRLWGAASLADFDTDAADRYVVLQQQFGGGDGVAGVGVALFESADAVSRIMKTIIDYYEDAAGLFRIASMLPASYSGKEAVLAWTAIQALRAARVEKVLLTRDDVDAIESDVLNAFGDDAEVTDATLFLAVWTRNDAMARACMRYAGFDGVCEPNALGFGLVMLGNISVARRLDVTDMDEDAIKGEVVRLVVEMRREHAKIKQKVGAWIATLGEMKRMRSSYVGILGYRSDVLAVPCFRSMQQTFDAVLATVFPAFVPPIDDTPRARVESYVRSSFGAAAATAAAAAASASAAAAAASSDDIDRKIRLTLAGIECLRSLGVFVLVGYETQEELDAMKDATSGTDFVIAKLVMSEMTLRQWSTSAVDPVLAAGDFVGGFGVTVYKDEEGECLWIPPLQTFSYSHEEDEEQLHVELTEALSPYLARCTSLAEAAAASRVERREAAEAAERRQIGRALQEAALVGASVGAAIEAAGEAEQEPPADFVLLPRDLPWERVYDREDADMPQIAKLRLTLPTDYPTGTVLKLPMPCLCGEHTSRFTKMKAGTSIIIKWDLGICGLVQEAGVEVEAEAERVAAEAEAARHADELLAEIETEKEAAAAKAKKKKKKKKKGGESRQSVAELAVALEGGATLEAEPVVELEAEQAPASVAGQATHAPAAISLADADFDTGRPDVPESTLGGETTCIVCFSRPKSHACVPCGHLSACEACSARMQHCPVCRAEAVMWMRIVAV